jgi:hypothetical protein
MISSASFILFTAMRNQAPKRLQSDRRAEGILNVEFRIQKSENGTEGASIPRKLTEEEAEIEWFSRLHGTNGSEQREKAQKNTAKQPKEDRSPPWERWAPARPRKYAGRRAGAQRSQIAQI